MLRLKIKKNNGEIVYKNFSEISMSEAIQSTVRDGGQVLSIDSIKSTEKKLKFNFEIYIFAKEMLTLLNAGLNISEVIETFILKEKNNSLKDIYINIQESLNNGEKFSNSLIPYNMIFPEIFISAIKSSETSGNIKSSLKRFIQYQLQKNILKQKVVSASIYPSILLIVGFIVIIFLLGYVVPRFSSIYDSSGRDIPILSYALLKIGEVINEMWEIVLLIIFMSLTLLYFLVKSLTFRVKLFQLFLNFENIKELLDSYYLSRFYRVLSLLLDAGMPLLEALSMSKNLLHEYYHKKLNSATREIEEGGKLSDSLTNNLLAPPVAYSLLKVGEKTGNTAEMLDNISDFFDEFVTYRVEFIMKVLEPALMIFIGLIIGVVVILLYLPIFDLAGTIT